MVRWLKNLLRKWVVEPEKEKHDYTMIDCYLKDSDGNTQLTKAKIIGSCGVYLSVIPIDSIGKETLITQNQAVDPNEFHRAWKHVHKNDIFTWEE